MLKYLRYALATLGFAASVGCLALWGWSITLDNVVNATRVPAGSVTLSAEVFDGVIVTSLTPRRPTDYGWIVDSFRFSDNGRVAFQQNYVRHQGQFGSFSEGVYFPLWYPALVFAFAGVGVFLVGRRFTLRSAIIATTVVAGVLGMAVIL